MNNFPPGFSGLPILFLGLALMSAPVGNAQQLVLRYPAIRDCNLNTVCWAGSQFVAAGENGAILTSSDGLVWVPRPSPVPQHWLTSAQGDGRIVLAGTQGGTITSSDGILWTPSTAPGSPQFPTSRPTLTDAVFFNGTFFIVTGGGHYFTSPNGAGWTRTALLAGSYPLFSLAVSQDAVVGLTAQIPANFLTSNGTDWTASLTNLNTFSRDLSWNGSRYVSVGDGGAIHSSADGSTWTSRVSGSTEDLHALCVTPDRLVAVGNAGTVLTSPTGTTWTVQLSNTTRDLKSVAWSGSQFVAVGSGGVVITSMDGSAWTTAYAGADVVRPVGVGWAGSTGLAVGSNGGTLVSHDGINWAKTPAASGPREPQLRLATNTNGTILVAATSIGLWSCPTDGSAWTSAGMSATHVLWDGERFVAPVITPGQIGGINRSPITPTSTDGVHWSSVVQPVTYNYGTEFWPTLAFLGTTYFEGERKTSDLVDWDFLQTISVFPKWVFGTGSKLIGVAGNGPVLECNDQQKWTQLYAGQESFTETLWTGTRLIGTIAGRGDFAHAVPGTPWSYTGLPGAKSLAWTGSRALIATGTGLFSVENLPAVPLTWEAYLNQAFPGITDPAIVGASANPDGDDSPNLVEYAMATDPSVLNVEPFVEIQPGTATSGTKYTWTQASNALGVVLVPQISADLLEWDDVTGTLVSSTPDSVTMTYTAPGRILRFFRLSARMVP